MIIGLILAHSNPLSRTDIHDNDHDHDGHDVDNEDDEDEEEDADDNRINPCAFKFSFTKPIFAPNSIRSKPQTDDPDVVMIITLVIMMVW